MSDFSTPNPSDPGESNGLGIAGFVVSLVGLCSGGVLSPVGLILSLVALNKRPKGFAVAGVIIGALGSCGILAGLIFLPVAVAAVLAALGFTALAVALGGPEIEAKVEMAVLTLQVEYFRDEHNGKLPLTLDEATTNLGPNSGFRTDHWKHPYAYQLKPDGSTYRIFSIGADGLPGTADDIFLDDDDAQGWPTPPTPPTDSPDSPAPDSDAPGDIPTAPPTDAPGQPPSVPR